MYITYDLLKEKGACSEGLKWFSSNFPEGCELCDETIAKIEDAKELSIKEAWADMPKEAVDYVKSLPEFDAEMFTKITGIEVK